MKLSVIVAIQNNVIGVNGTIPWKNEADMKMFKEVTSYTGISSNPNILLCGYNTYLTLPKKLTGNRQLIVMTSKDIPGVFTVKSWDDFFNNVPVYNKIFVIGGKALYEYALDSVFFEELYVTDIPGTPVYQNPVTLNINYNKLELIEHSGIMKKYKLKNRHFEVQYLELLNKIYTTGIKINSRNAFTQSIKDESIKMDLADGFPILTVKRVFWRGIVEELLWMLRGSTDVKELQAKNIHIWDGNSSKEFLKKRKLDYPEGEIGPSYGYQFRKGIIDQWNETINLIKTEPESRRIIINLWNVSDLNKMALPPCHLLYQFSVSEGKLNCHLYQRSWDIMLGWNTSTAALMTHILAKMTNLDVGTLTHTICDVHIYQAHIEGVIETLKRLPAKLPILNIKKTHQNIEDYSFEDFELINYKPQNNIKLEMIP